MKKNNFILIPILVFLIACKPEAKEKNVANEIKPAQKIVVLNPDEAIAELKNGNLRFLNKKFINTNYDEQIESSKVKQKPHSVILSCMDSRVPPEIIFDQGIGNVFVVRNAGNIEDENILGSMEYGVKFAGSKLIVVLGHKHCGAVTGAVKGVEAGNLSQLLGQIKPSIPEHDEHTDKAELIDQTIRNNVHKTINDILERSEIINEMVKSGSIKLIGAYYDIETGKVEFDI